MITPCIADLRRLATHVHSTLGVYQGVTHAVPDISRDLDTLMDSLKLHGVYAIQNGRKIDDDDKPVVDVMTAGANTLMHGDSTPLAAFNNAFNALRARMAVPVLNSNTTGGIAAAAPVASTAEPQASRTAEESATTSTPVVVADTEDADGGESASNGSLTDGEGDEDEDDGPELTLDEEGDTAIEMDLVERWDEA